MKKPRLPFVAKKHPNPDPYRRFACVDTRDGSVVSSYYHRMNAINAAVLSNSVWEREHAS